MAQCVRTQMPRERVPPLWATTGIAEEKTFLRSSCQLWLSISSRITRTRSSWSAPDGAPSNPWWGFLHFRTNVSLLDRLVSCQKVLDGKKFSKRTIFLFLLGHSLFVHFWPAIPIRNLTLDAWTEVAGLQFIELDPQIFGTDLSQMQSKHTISHGYETHVHWEGLYFFTLFRTIRFRIYF